MSITEVVIQDERLFETPYFWGSYKFYSLYSVIGVHVTGRGTDYDYVFLVYFKGFG